MLYRDLKPGDVVIESKVTEFVISTKKLNNIWITIQFVQCWDGQIEIYDYDYTSAEEISEECEVIRNE